MNCPMVPYRSVRPLAGMPAPSRRIVTASGEVRSLGSLGATPVKVTAEHIATARRSGFLTAVTKPARGLSGLGVVSPGGGATLVGAGASLIKTKNPLVGTAAKGATTGATVGSVFPVVGTAIGAAVGAILGAIGGAFMKSGPPESKIFDQWKQYAGKRGIELDNQFRNQAFTGLFRMGGKSSWPPKVKYGQRGDAAFLNAMAAQIGSAVRAGVIGAGDDAESIFAKVVQPWGATLGGNWDQGPAEWVNYGKRIVIQQIDAWMYDQPILSQSYTQSSYANPRVTDVIASLPQAPAPTPAPVPTPVSLPAPVVTPAPVSVQPAPRPQPVVRPIVGAGMPQPFVMPPAAITSPTVPPDQTAALIQQLMQQGASQQQAFAAAMQSLQAQGVQATPQIQQQVASDVAAATPATAGVGAMPGGVWAIAAGLVVLSFALARPAKRH